MTVRELIDALDAIADKTRPVRIEGCDCINPASGVEVDGKGVLITAAL